MEFFYEDMVEERNVTDVLDNIALITDDLKNGLNAIADLCLDRGTLSVDAMQLNGLMRLLSGSAHVIRAKVKYGLELAAAEKKAAKKEART